MISPGSIKGHIGKVVQSDYVENFIIYNNETHLTYLLPLKKILYLHK